MKISKTPWKISGISGILFVTLSFIASGINKMPPAYNQDNLSFIMWFSENGEWFRFGHLLAGLAFLLFYFPFFAGFCEILKKAEGEPAIWTKITWAGAIISPATGSIAGAFIIGLTLLKGNVSSGVYVFGLASYFYAYTIAGAYGGIVMICASIIILKTEVFKRWLGWYGLIVGFAAIISLGTLIENNPKGLFATINGSAWLAYFLWIAFLSIKLIRVPQTKIKS